MRRGKVTTMGFAMRAQRKHSVTTAISFPVRATGIVDIDEKRGKAEEGGEEVFPGGNPRDGLDMEGMDGKEAGAKETP